MKRRSIRSLALETASLVAIPAVATAARPRVEGMPSGSPGMDAGTRQDPYEGFLIDTSGHETVFASYPIA